MANDVDAVTNSPQETIALGESVGRLLMPGDLVLLHGHLGAGKSVFARGVGNVFSAHPWRGSPTFNLINEYGTNAEFVHVDLYRLSDREVEDLYLDEYVERGSVLVVEWPERAGQHLEGIAVRSPIHVGLTIDGESRRRVSIRRETPVPESQRKHS